MLTFYGGVCQLVLNKNCSHLVVPQPTGAKYECALKHASRIKIVTPDWVLDSVSAKGRQAEGSYHPRLVVHPLPDGMTENGDAEMHSEEEETEEGDNVEEDIRKQELEHQMRHVLSATAAERRRVASACLPVHFSSDDSSSGHSSPTRVPEGSPSSLSEPMSHRSLTCLKASPHFPALATQSPAVQPSGLLPAQPLQSRTTTLQAHLALLTGARVPSLHGLNLPLPRTPALAPQNNSVSSCPRLPMVPALPTELRLQGVIMSSSGAATMVPAASGARVFGAGADVSGSLMGRTSLNTDFGVMSPMVRTLRNITNSAEVQHSSRLSNVAHVLQSMSVPTRALDLRPSEARSLESSYLNTRDQDSVPSQPRDCITEHPTLVSPPHSSSSLPLAWLHICLCRLPRAGLGQAADRHVEEGNSPKWWSC
uniref:BRCT domain-containing protein n=1 Tax=Eptatretus burgeri TaxID=7764 RepID=A0A8C4QX09_EPTBU